MRDDTIGSPSPDHPLVVWVGDRPGIEEDRTKVAWTGTSGQLLRTGHIPCLPTAHHYLTTILPTYQNGKPAPSQYKEHHPALLTKLQNLSLTPASRRILVVMGAEPCRFVHHALDRSFPASIQKSLKHQLRTITIQGQPWTLLFTYNPAHLLEVPNLVLPAQNHINLLRLYMLDRTPERTTPNIQPPRAPYPSDPKTITLDIETYGAIERFPDGTLSPTQKETDGNGRFHPARSLFEDDPAHLVVTCAITLPTKDTADPRPLTLWDGTFPHCRETLSKLTPGTTLTFNLTNPRDRGLLGQWLRHADTIIGHNLLFDLQYLLWDNAATRSALPPFSKHLIDTSYLLFLEDETRPEKSLKDVGPLLGIYRYTETLANQRFATPTDRRLHTYNAEDTHNTLTLASTLAGLIIDNWIQTDKGLPECLAFASRTIWSVLGMLETGIPFSVPHLIALEQEILTTLDRLEAEAATQDLLLRGKGSKKSQAEFFTTITTDYPELLRHPLLQLTEKKREVSLSAINLKLAATVLPPEDPRYPLLQVWREHVSVSKLYSSYVVPRLYCTATSAKHWKGDRTRVNRSPTLIPEMKPCSSRSSRSLRFTGSTACPSSSQSVTSSTRTAGTTTTSSNVNQNPDLPPLPPTPIGMAYPRVYICPSTVTDSDDEQGGTEQARIIFKGPSVQTDPPIIQSIQTTRYPGWHLWAMDLSQIEMRVPALFSGDPILIESFTSNTDLHTRRAILDLGEPWLREQLNLQPNEPVTKNTPGFGPYRQCGKTLNFSDQFWATAPTMQRTAFNMANIFLPIEVFQRAEKNRPNILPDMYRWQEALQKEATAKGYLDLPFLGLTRRFIGGSNHHLNAILNFRVQTLAAAVLLDIQHRFSYHLQTTKPKWTLNYQVYDSLKGEVHPEHIPNLKETLDRCVQETETRGVWGQYQSMLGRKVPLAYDFETKAPRTSPPTLSEYGLITT